MSYYFQLQALKNRYRNIPSQIQLSAQKHNRVKMEYLLDQYDRQNDFLNKQIRQLLNENKKLKGIHYEHLKTQTDRIRYAKQQLKQQDIRERYRKAILGNQKQKEKFGILNSNKKNSSYNQASSSKINNTISQINHKYNPYDTYHRHNTSKQFLNQNGSNAINNKTSIYSFADQRKKFNSTQNLLQNKNKSQVKQANPNNSNSKINHQYKYSDQKDIQRQNSKSPYQFYYIPSASNEKGSNKNTNPQSKYSNQNNNIKEKYDYRYNNPYVPQTHRFRRQDNRELANYDTPSTVPPNKPHQLFEMAFNNINKQHPNREPYVNQQTFIERLSDSNINVIGIGGKSKSRSRSSSPKKDQNLQKIPRDGKQFYQSVKNLTQIQNKQEKKEQTQNPIQIKHQNTLINKQKQQQLKNPFNQISRLQNQRAIHLQTTPVDSNKSKLQNSSYLNQQKAFTVETNYSPNVNVNKKQERKAVEETIKKTDSQVESQVQRKTERNWGIQSQHTKRSPYYYQNNSLNFTYRPNSHLSNTVNPNINDKYNVNSNIDAHHISYKIQEPIRQAMNDKSINDRKSKKKFLSLTNNKTAKNKQKIELKDNINLKKLN